MNEFSVTPLGTVSPFPTMECNCPGFLVQDGDKKILLDCGSGVVKYFNNIENLKNLMIILSHLHFDHFSDLGEFAYESYVYHNLGMLNDKIKVYYPYNYLVNDNIMKQYEDNSFLDLKFYTNLDNIEYGDMKISFLKNLHDIVTYAVKIMSNGVSLVYTADTDYNDNLVEFCDGVDLLISESSLLRGQAKVKGHMYAYEAGKLANEANVKQLVLTHFFPLIDKQEYVMEAKDYFENTIGAVEGKKLILRKSDF